MSYNKQNRNRSNYNKSRYINYLKSQQETFSNYKPELSKEVIDELNLIKDSDYFTKVNALVTSVVRHPKEDSNKDPKLNIYNCDGFNIPEATHRRSEYDSEEGQM